MEKQPEFLTLGEKARLWLASDSFELWAKAEFRPIGREGRSTMTIWPKKMLEELGVFLKRYKGADLRVIKDEDELRAYALSGKAKGKQVIIMELEEK